MSAYVSKYYSNCKKDNVFCKTLMAEGIFGRLGKTYSISGKTMENNIKKFEGKDIVLEHDNNKVVGKVLEIFNNGSEGVIDRKGDIYNKTGWTCIYELDKDLLEKNGVSLEEASKLDLSTSYRPIFNNHPDLYNGAKVDFEVTGFDVNNVAIVKKGRYNETRNIVNNSEDILNLTFTNIENNGKQQDMEEDKKIDNSFEEKKEEKKEENKEQQDKPQEEKHEKSESEGGKGIQEGGNENKFNADNLTPNSPSCQQQQETPKGQMSVDFGQMTMGLQMLNSFMTQLRQSMDIMSGKIQEQQPAQQAQQAQPAPAVQEQQPVEQQQEQQAPVNQEQPQQQGEVQQQPQQEQQQASEGGDNLKQQTDLMAQWVKEHQKAVNKLRQILTPENYNEIILDIINGDKGEIVKDDSEINNNLENEKKEENEKKTIKKFDNNFLKFYSF